MKKRERTYSGTTDPAVSARERENRAIARRAAAEGMTLLENDGLLPLAPGTRVALFGGGAVKPIKGGTGSGDVNEREVVSLYEGFVEAGLVLTNRDWLDRFAETYRKAREAWRETIVQTAAANKEHSVMDAYSANVFRMPAGDEMQESDLLHAEAAFYVVSRTAGESADRLAEAGDYALTEAEKAQLTRLSTLCKRVVVVLNTGGQIDLRFIRALPNLSTLLSIAQPGMEGGHALGDLVTGRCSPSGKLADTWALCYEDYPNAAIFSHCDNDVDNERYLEGMYVGYRYFDSFEKPVAYPFGFGLSYTGFSLKTERIETDGNRVTVSVRVTNTGKTHAGKEVVQAYLSCPQTALPKVSQRLVAFRKTKLLSPGESESVRLSFDAKDCASFSEQESAWLIEAGEYAVRVGNSSVDTRVAAVLSVAKTVAIERVAAICPLREPISELVCPAETRREQERAWRREAEENGVPVVAFAPRPIEKAVFCSKTSQTAAAEAARIVERLSREQLISLVIGEINKGQGNVVGAAGILAPGAAGETSGALEADFGVPGVPMADGPAGLRLVKSYEVDRTDGSVLTQDFLSALEGGFFADQTDHENAVRYYQYATAIPVGTLLAQTWDTALLQEVGRAVAREMQEFGVGWWLAPGMNIHRNPLCGRNFEYYSEDPTLTGNMAAAITGGVQSVPGVGTTIKHFACNNQEDNRMASNSILTERTLREIYLRGFELAVRLAQPMCIMTSYNLINGVHTANSLDLCTETARNEWGFAGVVMTDWTTTMPWGGSEPWRCIAAGNDLIMPGCQGDIDSISAALDDGRLSIDELKACAKRVLTVILQTLVFENAVPYGA